MPQPEKNKYAKVRLQPVLRAMRMLFLSVGVLLGSYGCEKEHTCDATLEWECNIDALSTFLRHKEVYQHDEAQEYCDNLVLKDHSDWRLPTDCELSALASRLSAQNEGVPLSSRMATCWSSTPYHDSLLRYWAVSVFNNQAAPLSRDTYNAVLCVRDTRR